MSDSTLVSVVIPTYNRAGLIKRSVESVLNQTYPHLEVIVVDDSSTDNTKEVLSSINDERFKPIFIEKNQGACHARNVGNSNAAGEFIASHDSDDIWDPHKLELQLKFMQEKNYDLSFCQILRIDTGGHQKYAPSKKFHFDKDSFFPQLLKSNFIPTITTIVKRDVQEQITYDASLKRFTDWDFALRVAKAGYSIGYLPRQLATSYIQNDSACVLANRYKALKVIFDKFYSDIKKYPEVEASYYAMFGTCLVEENPKLAKEYYRKSLSLDKTFSVMARNASLSMGLLNTARKLKHVICNH